MTQTQQAIDNLAGSFCMLKAHDKALYVRALESLVRLAISEHDATPAMAVQRDLQRVTAIQARSKHS